MRVRVRLIPEAYEGRALLGAALLPEDALEIKLKRASLTGSNKYGTWTGGYMPYVKAYMTYRFKVGSEYVYTPQLTVIGANIDYTNDLNTSIGCYLLEGEDSTGNVSLVPLFFENSANPRTVADDPYCVRSIKNHAANQSELYFGSYTNKSGYTTQVKPKDAVGGQEPHGYFVSTLLAFGIFSDVAISDTVTGVTGLASCFALTEMFGPGSHIRPENIKRLFFSAELQTFFCQFDDQGSDDWRIYKNGARVYGTIAYYDKITPAFSASLMSNVKHFNRTVHLESEIDAVSGKIKDAAHPVPYQKEVQLKGSKKYRLTGSIHASSSFRPCLVIDQLTTQDERPVNVITYKLGGSTVATFNYLKTEAAGSTLASEMWCGPVRKVAPKYEQLFRVTASSDPSTIYSKYRIDNAILVNILAQSSSYAGEIIVVLVGDTTHSDTSQQLAVVLHEGTKWMMVDAKKVDLRSATIAQLIDSSTQLSDNVQSYIVATGKQDESTGLVVPLTSDYNIVQNMITDVYSTTLKIDTAPGGVDSSIVAMKVQEITPALVDPVNEADKKANETDKKEGHTSGSISTEVFPTDRTKKGKTEVNYKSVAIVLGGVTAVVILSRS